MTAAVRREAYRWVAKVLEAGVGEYRAWFEGRPDLLEEIRRIGAAMEAAGLVDEVAEALPVAEVVTKTTNGAELYPNGVMLEVGPF